MTEFLSSVPVVPARDIEASAAWYRDHLGFDVFLTGTDYGIVGRDESWLHFHGAGEAPAKESETVVRMGVRGIDELFQHCRSEGIVHPEASLTEEPWGFREFSVVDIDGHLLTFFEPPAGYDPRET